MLEVSAGVIRGKDGRVLICRRTGKLDGLWEFPGGKREHGESIAECLRRELKEELDIDVTVGEPIAEVVRRDGEKALKLIFLSASMVDSSPLSLRVHGRAEWVEPQRLAEYQFCEGDRAFIEMGLL